MFRGIGEAMASPAEPVKVEFKNFKYEIVFWVINIFSLPTLIGKFDLANMGVVVDPINNQILKYGSFEPMNFAYCEIFSAEQNSEQNEQKQKTNENNELELIKIGL